MFDNLLVSGIKKTLDVLVIVVVAVVVVVVVVVVVKKLKTNLDGSEIKTRIKDFDFGLMRRI